MQTPSALMPGEPPPAPDHKQLPDEDGSIVHNFQERLRQLAEKLRATGIDSEA